MCGIHPVYNVDTLSILISQLRFNFPVNVKCWLNTTESNFTRRHKYPVVFKADDRCKSAEMQLRASQQSDSVSQCSTPRKRAPFSISGNEKATFSSHPSVH